MLITVTSATVSQGHNFRGAGNRREKILMGIQLTWKVGAFDIGQKKVTHYPNKMSAIPAVLLDMRALSPADNSDVSRSLT